MHAGDGGEHTRSVPPRCPSEGEASDGDEGVAVEGDGEEDGEAEPLEYAPADGHRGSGVLMRSAEETDRIRAGGFDALHGSILRDHH